MSVAHVDSWKRPTAFGSGFLVKPKGSLVQCFRLPRFSGGAPLIRTRPITAPCPNRCPTWGSRVKRSTKCAVRPKLPLASVTFKWCMAVFFWFVDHFWACGFRPACHCNTLKRSMNLTSKTICLHQWPSLISGSPSEVSKARNWTASLFLNSKKYSIFVGFNGCLLFAARLLLCDEASYFCLPLLPNIRAVWWPSSIFGQQVTEFQKRKALAGVVFVAHGLNEFQLVAPFFVVCGCRCVDFTPAESAKSLLTKLEIAATAAVFLELSQHTGRLDPCLSLRMWQRIQTKAVKPASTCG